MQETAIGMARRLPEFVYDPKVCRFKTWLLNLTRWRIQNQLGKREQPGAVAGNTSTMGDGTGTGTIDRIADSAAPEFEVAKTLGISIARVYLTKHRVAGLVKKEVRRLEKVAEQTLRG